MATGSSSSPAWLAVAATIALGAILTVALVSTAKVMGADGAPTTTEQPVHSQGASRSREVERPKPPGTTLPDWASRLYESTCADGCIGGVACAVTGNKPCPSKFTCIPGTADDRLEPDLPLNLRLSGVVPLDATVNYCALNAFVCFKPASTREPTCIPLADACRHEGRSTETVPVKTRDLVSDGVGISVHMGSTTALPIATGTIRYGTYIARVGLCSGFIVGGMDNANANLATKYVSYFLEPRL